MKRIFYINTALILLLCAASSCIKETEIGRSKSDGPLPVKLSLHLPSDMRGGASTRSIAVEDESTIADVELLAFLDDGGGNFQYTYSAPVESTTNNDGQVEIVATAQGYTRQQIFMVLVNAPAGTSSGIVRGMSLAAARGQLLVSNANEWNAASSADYKPLPMYAETSAAAVTAGATLGNYDLVRMLARMDVRLKAGVSNFEIVEAHLFNRRTSGQMAFPFDAATWDATNKRVRKTTYPQAAIPGAYKPSYYDSPGYASTPYKADVTDDPRGEILRSIYTFEAKGVSEADRLDATAVIVGGKYGGSNDVTYYRVDIVTASTPAGNCSQDILRNHWYDIEIQSFSGAGYGNPEDAFIGGSQLTATVTEWNLATQGVIGDGQWWLMVNRDEIAYDYLGGESEITAQTNYNPVPTQGFPAGIRVDDAEIEYTPAVTPGEEWITLTGGNDGDMLRTIKIAAAQNASATGRAAKVKIRAGNFTKIINVKQDRPGGNADRITWDSANQQYVITNDPRDAGLYFKFGSVVGIYTDHHAIKNLTPPMTSSTDTFDAGDVAWSPITITGSGAAGWPNVPFPSTVTTINTAYHTIANVKAGKGDPCRLVGLDLTYIKNTAVGSLTLDDIDNKTWRMPTLQDNKNFCGQTAWVSYDSHWWAAGQSGNISSNVAGGEFPERGKGGLSKFFPATGMRNGNDGQVAGVQGNQAYIWSSESATSTTGYQLYFGNLGINPTDTRAYTVGMAVRCVRQ